MNPDVNGKPRSWVSVLAWVLFAIISVMTIWSLIIAIQSGELAKGNSGAAFQLLLPISFALVGALILSRQPRNTIGWLLMLPAIVFSLDLPFRYIIQDPSATPAAPSLALWLAVWTAGVGWVAYIFPILFIPLLFPNGSPPTPRWRWVAAFGIFLVVFFLVIASLAQQVTPDTSTYGVTWEMTNPIGFLSQDTIDVIFGAPWGIALGLFTLLSFASLFVRFRRAGPVEREQIKWLLYASAIFTLVYAPPAFANGDLSGTFGDIFSLLLVIASLAFPLAIGIAILRYRLFDIDILIRRTLTYAIVAVLLAVVYFGSVIILQQLFASLTGQRSEVITVLSTLAIAALFVPVRNWVQTVIDRRFNRQKYNAQQVLADFGNTVRDETDLDKLTGRLIEVVNETMQPHSISLWLKKESRGK